MKDPLNRTKVVVRHLPPSISQSALLEQIDGRFSGRYKWFSFRPGKNSQKNYRQSRAYIDFHNPEDVLHFAEYFDGHIFVNEKGAQFKAVVEYAPSQRVPKVSKKDGREGSILKDPEYVEFMEFISKPVENLPSADIQLERREAERAGGPKETVIVTPLMDFIRQRRAAKSGSQRSSANGKLNRRSSEAVTSSGSSKRGSDKRKGPTAMYVQRDTAKISDRGKDKSAYTLVSRKEEEANRTEVIEDGTGVGSNGSKPVIPGSVEIGQRRVVLLKGKEREASQVSSGLSKQQNATISVKNITGPSLKQSQQQEVSGRMIRSILSSRDTRQSPSYMSGVQSEQQTQLVNSEREKRPPRPPNPRLPRDHISSLAKHSSFSDIDGKRSQDEKAGVSNMHGSVSPADKNEKRMRNRDRPDRGVWAPRRSDGFVDDISQSSQQLSRSLEGISVSQRVNMRKDVDDDMTFQNSSSQGVHRRRGSAHGMKEVDGPPTFSEGKPSKRGASVGYGSHEKQVWVQKSGPGS